MVCGSVEPPIPLIPLLYIKSINIYKIYIYRILDGLQSKRYVVWISLSRTVGESRHTSRFCCIIKTRKEHIMDFTILGFRIRIYQDPKVPKQVHLYITSRDGTTFYVLIQDMGKSVK